jgi:hypothetical protein
MELAHPTQAQIDEDYHFARAMQVTMYSDERPRDSSLRRKRPLPVEDDIPAFLPGKGKRRRLVDASGDAAPLPKSPAAPVKAVRQSVPAIDVSSDDEDEVREVLPDYYCEMCQKDCHNPQGMASHCTGKIHRANLEEFCARVTPNEYGSPTVKDEAPIEEAPSPIALSDDSVYEVAPTSKALPRPALTIVRPHFRPAPAVVRQLPKPTLTIIRPYLRPALVIIRPYLKGGPNSRSHPSTK